MPPTPLRVVCALVFHEHRILATRRDPRRSFPLLWEFPGGKIEDGEDSVAALHRELHEELVLKVTVDRELEPVTYSTDSHHLELIPFACRPDQTCGIIPRDHVEVRWMDLDDVHTLEWAPADVPLVRDLPAIHRMIQ